MIHAPRAIKPCDDAAEDPTQCKRFAHKDAAPLTTRLDMRRADFVAKYATVAAVSRDAAVRGVQLFGIRPHAGPTSYFDPTTEYLVVLLDPTSRHLAVVASTCPDHRLVAKIYRTLLDWCDVISSTIAVQDAELLLAHTRPTTHHAQRLINHESLREWARAVRTP